MKKVFIFLLLFFATFINVFAEGDYVTGIKIDDVNYSEFSTTKTDYEINVDSSKEKIKIAYIYDKNIYIGQGTSGEIALDYGTKSYTFTLTNINDSNDKKTYKFTITKKDTRSNDNSLSSLSVGGSKVVLGTGNDYKVDVDGKLTGITIEAKTTSDKASFVDGYGPRTIDINSPSCEIKVKAENGEIRTYKITINKTNVKSSDATLKMLSTDKINFDFKPTTYEYELTATSDISKIKITAVPNSDKASLTYKEEVILVTGDNIIEIKVTAEDGTSKVYKLTIKKEKEVPIVSDIKIKDVKFTFDPEKYSYTLETNLTTLDFDVTLSKDTATSDIKGNENLKNGSVITLEAKDGDKTITYKFKILNEEEFEEDKEIITTGNSNFFEKNEMLIGLAVFGVGLISLLISILLKPKSKIM